MFFSFDSWFIKRKKPESLDPGFLVTINIQLLIPGWRAGKKVIKVKVVHSCFHDGANIKIFY